MSCNVSIAAHMLKFYFVYISAQVTIRCLEWEPRCFQILFLRWSGLLFRRLSSSRIGKELDGLSNNLCKIAGFALVLVLIRLEASFDVDQASLFQVFLAHLAQTSPGFDIHPIGRFLRPAFLALPAVADGEAEVGDLLAGGGELAFGVPAQASDQLNAV